MLSMTPDALAAARVSPLPSDTVTDLEFGRAYRDHREADYVQPGDIGGTGNSHRREETPHGLECLFGRAEPVSPGPVLFRCFRAARAKPAHVSSGNNVT